MKRSLLSILVGMALVLWIGGCSSNSNDSNTGGDEDSSSTENTVSGPLNPDGALSGIFIDPLLHISQDAAEIAAYVNKLKSNGYNTIVIPYLMQLNWTLYPTESDVLSPYKQDIEDWVQKFLAAADTVNMQVFLGLVRDHRIEHFYDDDPSDWELSRMKALVADYESRWGEFASYTGVYLHWETPTFVEDTRNEQMRAVVVGLASYLHDYYPKRQIAVRIRYPGIPITNFLSVDTNKWIHPEEIDDSQDITDWALQWMQISQESFINYFVVEVQNGMHIQSLSKAAKLAKALDSNRENVSTHIAMLFDGFDTMPQSDDSRLVRRDVANFNMNWQDAKALLEELPEGAEVWGFDERSIVDDLPQVETDMGYPAEMLQTMQDSAIWTENHLERCCMRNGMVVTVGSIAWDIDRGKNEWQEDACWLTGLYLSAITYKALVTNDPADKAKASYLFKSLLKQANATPLKGEVVRNFVYYLYNQNAPVPPDSTTIKRWHKHPEKEIYWVGDISADQLSGYFHGIATYYDLLATDDEKQLAKDTFASVASLIINNDWHAKEFNGQNTTYGDLNIEPILAFDLASIAYHMTGARTFVDAYADILDRGFMTGYFQKLAVMLYMPGQVNFQHFVDSGFYHVLMYSYVPQVYGEVALAMMYIYERSFFYGLAWGDINYTVFDPKSEGGTRAVWQMYKFNPQYLENRRWFKDVNQNFESGFVPMDKRPAREFEWHTTLDKRGGASPRGGPSQRYSGVGYLLTYWMARWHGIIP